LKKGKTLASQFPTAAEDKEKDFEKPAPGTVKPQATETGDFNAFAEFIPQFGQDAALLKEIFDRKDAATVERVIAQPDAFVVMQVTERKTPSDTEFEKQRAQLKVEAVKAKQFENRETFLKTLKANGKVITNDVAIAKIVGEG
jgi:peptidyl-prolyl cis-trans isomerase D